MTKTEIQEFLTQSGAEEMETETIKLYMINGKPIIVHEVEGMDDEVEVFGICETIEEVQNSYNGCTEVLDRSITDKEQWDLAMDEYQLECYWGPFTPGLAKVVRADLLAHQRRGQVTHLRRSEEKFYIFHKAA